MSTKKRTRSSSADKERNQPKPSEAQKSLQQYVEDCESGTAGFSGYIDIVDKIGNFFVTCSVLLDDLEDEPSLLSLVKASLANVDADEREYMIQCSLRRACTIVLRENWPLLHDSLTECFIIPLLSIGVGSDHEEAAKLAKEFAYADSTFTYKNAKPAEAIALYRFVVKQEKVRAALQDASDASERLPFFEM